MTSSSRAKKENLLRAASAAKGLGQMSLFELFPMRRVPYVGHRVDGLTDPVECGRPTPLSMGSFYNQQHGNSKWVSLAGTSKHIE